MKRNAIFLSISLIIVFSMVAGLTTSTAQSPNQPAVDMGDPGLSYRYVQSYGETQVPYPADTVHLNTPVGLFMDGDDNLYVTEDWGDRVLKYNSVRSNLLVLGTAGVSAWTMGWNENLLYGPKDVGLDNSGNIWVADANRIVQYDPDAVYLQQLPDDPWASGDDNTHFDDIHGIAFNSLGQMFVSDRNNQRVQVYDLTSGLVYSTTLGVTGVPGNDNNHFNQPWGTAIDSLDHLYVVDYGNGRVQKCTYAAGWGCTPLDTGLNHPQGLAVDGSDNVYIADTDNYRIRKCSSSGTCTDFATATPRLADLAVDSGGNVYGTVTDDYTVIKYDSSGLLVGPYLGVQGVPYLTDNNHYNVPLVSTDAEDNILITEEFGHRLIKLDPKGNFLWSFGVPGVGGWDEEHLNSPQRVAVDSSGNIYVPDRWACRVLIISPDGDYLDTLGTGCGSGDYQFWSPLGVAVDVDGNIYVVDSPNQRVMIYDSTLVYTAQIGITGACGADNDHFCDPNSVAIDSAGNIYVADLSNNRVQKFNSSRVWQMSFGTGIEGQQFDQFAGPEDIAIDTEGIIYVSDAWNNRVQVFDSTGAYLTTIGGAQGTDSAQFYTASSVAVDNRGNVYVSDNGNCRIQKYSPGVLGWKQVNINGFGSPSAVSLILEPFNGQLYAGTLDWTYGTQIWRTSDGMTWNPATTPGEGIAFENSAIVAMSEFGGKLYAGTGWNGKAPELWRATDGTDWQQVMTSTVVAGGAFDAFVVFGDQLYTTVGSDSAGVTIYRSSTGDLGSWSPIVSDGNGDVNNIVIRDFALFNDQLYAVGFNYTAGAFVWQSSADGSTWTQVNTPGFGATKQAGAESIAVFNGTLYVGTSCDTLCVAGYSEIWKTTNGTDWSLVVTDFENDEYGDVNSLYTFDGTLFAIVSDGPGGNTVWRTHDGTSWQQVNPDGWGDSNSLWSMFDHGITAFNNQLYVATSNNANGAEVWVMQRQLYLPLVNH